MMGVDKIVVPGAAAWLLMLSMVAASFGPPLVQTLGHGLAPLRVLGAFRYSLKFVLPRLHQVLQLRWLVAPHAIVSVRHGLSILSVLSAAVVARTLRSAAPMRRHG